mmetsp:Transcript_58027/g.168358  ORF Transcript_58027/g.168358 Transcript_58027/m.168358 type:complete len:619 (-) Transcript_58027:173-2029(-)
MLVWLPLFLCSPVSLVGAHRVQRRTIGQLSATPATLLARSSAGRADVSVPTALGIVRDLGDLVQCMEQTGTDPPKEVAQAISVLMSERSGWERLAALSVSHDEVSMLLRTLERVAHVVRRKCTAVAINILKRTVDACFADLALLGACIPSLLSTLSAWTSCSAVDTSGHDTLLDIIQRLTQDQRNLLGDRDIEAIAAALYALVRQAQQVRADITYHTFWPRAYMRKKADTERFARRVIVLCEGLRLITPKGRADAHIVCALEGVVGIEVLDDVDLHSIVATLAAIMGDHGRILALKAAGCEAELARTVEHIIIHDSATPRVLGEVLAAARHEHSEVWLQASEMLVNQLSEFDATYPDIAKLASSAHTWRLHALRHVLHVGQIPSQVGINLTYEALEEYGCQTVLELFADAPEPLDVASPRLFRLPSVVVDLIGNFVFPPSHRLAVERESVAVITACAHLAMEGHVDVARSLWLAACVPSLAVAAAAASSFSAWASGSPVTSIGQALLPEDFKTVAECLRPPQRGGRDIGDSDAAELEASRAAAVLHGMAAVLDAWPSEMDMAVVTGVAAICSATQQVVDLISARSSKETVMGLTAAFGRSCGDFSQTQDIVDRGADLN